MPASLLTGVARTGGAQNITATGSVTAAQSPVNLIAQQSIVLGPGFSTGPGSTFSAIINPALTGGTTTVQEYVAGIEYKGSTIEAIYHPEGRCTPKSGGGWQYEYTLKDHLGNTRLAFTDQNSDGTVQVPEDILQENHYYPFGLGMQYAWMNNAGQPDNKYQYNGKELNEEFGLGWSDYGARWYDAAVGRWGSVDPLGEKYQNWSGYNYVLGNPVRFIDPDGMEIIAPNEASRQLVLQSVTYMFGNNHGYAFDGDKLVHNGATPPGMTSGQNIMFSYFNGTLVNSETTTTVKANQRLDIMEIGNEAPKLISVSGSTAASTFEAESYQKVAGVEGSQVKVYFNAQNTILVPSETVSGGVNVITKGGTRAVGADHALSHEFGHAIVNTIMNEFGGEFNGVNFNSMTDEERSDWAIRFTNTLLSPKSKQLETGESQHGRNETTKPVHTLEPLKN